MSFRELFSKRKPIIGVIHLRPLPGSPRWSGDWDSIETTARQDAAILAVSGADGLLVENYGDAPFYASRVEPITVAAMTALTRGVREEIRGSVPVGVNVLRNDALAALSVAAVVKADFIRINVHCGVMVTDQGMIEGTAAVTLRERARHRLAVLIFADVWVKHGTPLDLQRSIGSVARDTYDRGGADALIVTGESTGEPASLAHIEEIRRAVPEAPLLIGSGVTAETVVRLLDIVDGIIVGTSLKRDGVVTNPVDPEAARILFARRDKPTQQPGSVTRE